MGGDGDLGDEVGFWRSEARRWQARAERSEAEAAQLRERVVELEGQVGALFEKVAELSRLAFGKSSEKQTVRRPAGQPVGEGGPDSPNGAGQGGGRAWSRAAEGFTGARPTGLLPSPDRGAGPRRAENRAGVPALRGRLRAVR